MSLASPSALVVRTITPITVSDAELRRRQVRFDELAPPGVRIALADSFQQAAQQRPIGEANNPRQGGGNGDLLDLRELKPGEDSRRIHWLKSAGAGKLLRAVREREERDTFTLRVDKNLPSERLDARCAEVAALAQRLLQRGYEVGLEADGQLLRPGRGVVHQRRILDALAWAGFLPEERNDLAGQ